LSFEGLLIEGSPGDVTLGVLPPGFCFETYMRFGSK
jgi:hypothetical protein